MDEGSPYNRKIALIVYIINRLETKREEFMHAK